MTSPQPSIGFAAQQYLVENAAEGISFFQKKLIPVKSISKEQASKLITALDASTFDARESAMKNLIAVADLIQQQLKDSLATTMSAEVRQRLRTILDSCDESKPVAGDVLRTLRALEVLERIGSADAKSLLKSLSRVLQIQ